ncbi:MAG: serine/threonine-protein kinase [Candidatus Eremiobacterota bacterium]
MSSGKVLNGRYEIIKLITIVDFINIYSAFDYNTEEKVVVKELSYIFLDPVIKEDVVEQFKKEGKIYHKIIHPNLARYIDYFEHIGKLYIIMEHFEEKNLKELLEEYGRGLEAEKVILWGISLCNVLSSLHDAKPASIIFKNLSPDSIFLKNDGELKLFNLGMPPIDNIYKSTTKTRSFHSYFSSPDQYRGRLDIKSDIYSLGAVMYYLLTGSHPPDPSKLATTREIIPPLRNYNRDILPGLEELVLKSMSLASSDRYNSAEDMKRELKEVYFNIIEIRESEEADGKEQKDDVSPAYKKDELSKKFLDVRSVIDTGSEKEERIRKFGKISSDIKVIKEKKMSGDKYNPSTEVLKGGVVFPGPSPEPAQKLKTLLELKKEERKRRSTLMLEKVTSSISTEDGATISYIYNIQNDDPKKTPVESKKSELPKNMILKERYKILDVISITPLSINYMGFDIKANNYLFIKELTDTFRDLATKHQAIAQFKMEAKILFKLIHPNLPRYQDYFDYEYKRYLIMEYIEGKNFETIVNETPGFIEEKQVVKWGLELCDVLFYLHNMKPEPIIFRNLRPDNIILSRTGLLKLMDFGISKFFHADKQTLEVAKIINPHFSPFEQYSGRTDVRTDIYSLGAVMYFLVTGTKPADAIDISMETKVLKSCRVFNPAISLELDNLILKAMRMYKEHRHQSVDELRAELKRLL